MLSHTEHNAANKSNRYKYAYLRQICVIVTVEKSSLDVIVWAVLCEKTFFTNISNMLLFYVDKPFCVQILLCIVLLCTDPIVQL